MVPVRIISITKCNANSIIFCVADTINKMWNATESPADEYTPYDERPETYIVPVLFFVIFVVGVLGNGTLVVIFLRHKTMRNVPNT